MAVLFISYQEASDPLMLSQGLSYIKGLIDKQNSFILLTYEKNTNESKIASLLRSLGITWYTQRYHSRPRLFATIYDIFVGILSIDSCFWKCSCRHFFYLSDFKNSPC